MGILKTNSYMLYSKAGRFVYKFSKYSNNTVLEKVIKKTAGGMQYV